MKPSDDTMRWPGSDDTLSSNSGSLSPMMDLDLGEAGAWRAEELGAVFAHQLSAPLTDDLKALGADAARRLAEAAPAGGPPILTFGDLLHHPRPPVELLDATKRFAKVCRSHPDGPLPDEVATVLYLAAIAAAMLRCGRRISRMDNAALDYSFGWALRQGWLDAATRRLFQEAKAAADDASGTEGGTP
jgi:hypothetical protein